MVGWKLPQQIIVQNHKATAKCHGDFTHNFIDIIFEAKKFKSPHLSNPYTKSSAQKIKTTICVPCTAIIIFSTVCPDTNKPAIITPSKGDRNDYSHQPAKNTADKYA